MFDYINEQIYQQQDVQDLKEKVAPLAEKVQLDFQGFQDLRDLEELQEKVAPLAQKVQLDFQGF